MLNSFLTNYFYIERTQPIYCYFGLYDEVVSPYKVKILNMKKDKNKVVMCEVKLFYNYSIKNKFNFITKMLNDCNAWFFEIGFERPGKIFDSISFDTFQYVLFEWEYSNYMNLEKDSMIILKFVGK